MRREKWRVESGKWIIFLCVLCVLCVKISAQPNTPYTIPRQVFVGDRASLIVPLSSSVSAQTEKTQDLPTHKYIDFHKITLLHDRLIIEFTAWAPGELELPLIEIGGHYFPDLKIGINSVIDTRKPITLSAPASSLVMPGTAVMVYGFIALIVFILIFAIWFFTKGKMVLAVWREKLKRHLLFYNMHRTIQRLNRAIIKKTDPRIVLDKLSKEYRNFLSILLNQNCRAMTASELGDELLIKCDNYRFSGMSVNQNIVLELLTEVRHELHELARIEEKKHEL